MEWIIVSGSTVEAARDRALEALSIALEDADVDVLSEPSSSWWGLRRQPARVRVRVRPIGPPPRLGEDRRNRRRQRGRSSSGKRSPKRGQHASRSPSSGSRPSRRRNRSGRNSGSRAQTAGTSSPSSSQREDAGPKTSNSSNRSQKQTDIRSKDKAHDQVPVTSRRRRLPGV